MRHKNLARKPAVDKHSFCFGVRARDFLILSAAVMLSACSLIPQSSKPSTVKTSERPDPSTIIIAEAIDMMARLSQGSPAQQAEIFQAIREAAEVEPTTHNRLRYALSLATPGHGDVNYETARQQLSTLLATPDLLPGERALAGIMLKNVEQRLVLQAENERLQSEKERLERERTTATSRRLQTEIEENARLRKELQEAQAKLDEIARLERSISERSPPKPKKTR